MSFSIVTVVLNASFDLPLTLESIIQQDFEDYEIIIVDGGSTDQLNEVVNRYEKYISRFIRIEDAGVFFAMNEALDYCSKEYVIFMNAKDRFYSENVLRKVKSRIKGKPDVVFGDHIYVDKGKEIFQKAQMFDLTFSAIEEGNNDGSWMSLIPCHQATFTRLSLLKEFRYDTRFELCADHDFMFKAYTNGYKFQYIDETICHYIGGGISAQRIDRLSLEQTYLYRQYSFNPHNIDKLILPGIESPFSNQTRKTGILLTGFKGEEGPYPEHGIPTKISWCREPSFRVLTPFDRPALACIIKGYNIFKEQKIFVYNNNSLIASSEIPIGYFTKQIDFLEFVGSRSIIEYSLAQYGPTSENNTDMISVAIGSINFPSFVGKGITIASGDKCEFNKSNEDMTSGFFVSGWADQEESHRWSIGSSTYFSVRTEGDVQQLNIEISPNPFVSSDNKFIEMNINGADNYIVQLKEDINHITIDCQNQSWKQGAYNIVIIKNNFFMKPPGDPRLLGVCFYSISAV